MRLTSPSASTAPGYRPDIDALRAFAVLPVVLFHLGASWLPGGFLGVDVFFVISGYLITGLLLRELNAGGIDLLAFWRRRILRILPALLVMVLVTFILGHVFLYAPDRYMLAVNSAGALLSVGNITHWRNYGGYWSADATDSPLLHTWSLGVEEQFYILYPLALLVAWRLLKDRTWMLLAGGLLGGTVLYVVASQRSPAAAFYLLPTRAWELLAGALAAAYNVRRAPSQRVATAMSLSGLGLILAAYAVATEAHHISGALLAVSGATLVVAAGSPDAFHKLRLTVRPIIVIGLVSYSIYLWHWPVIVLGAAFETRSQVVISPVAYFAASLVLGWVSWRLVETPLRHAHARWVPVGALAMTVVLATGIYALRGYNGSEVLERIHAARWDGELYNVNPIAEWPDHARRRMAGIDVSPRPSGRIDAHRRGIEGRYGSHAALDVLVLGDSHGLMWAPAIDAAARELKVNIKFMTTDGTPVFFDPAKPDAYGDGLFFSQAQWSEFNRARLNVIRSDQPRIVLIGSNWRPEVVPEARSLLREITAQGSRVLLIEDAPDFVIGDRNAPAFMAYLGVEPDGEGRAFSQRVDWAHTAYEMKAVRMLAANCPDACRIVPVHDLFKGPDSRLLIQASARPTYIDDDHLSVSGAMLAKQRIINAIAASLQVEGGT